MKRAIALALVSALAALADATTVRPMSVDQLTQAASMVVEAQATHSWAQWNPEHTIIFTYTRLSVLKPLKGAPGPEIVIKQPGGIVRGIGQVVPGVRHLLPGENVLLFLRTSAAQDGTYVLVGLMQGHFRVYRARNGGMAASNGMTGVSVLHAGAITSSYRGLAMSLEESEMQVKRECR